MTRLLMAQGGFDIGVTRRNATRVTHRPYRWVRHPCRPSVAADADS